MKGKILLIYNEDAERLRISEALIFEGYEVIPTKNGANLLSLQANTNFSGAVFDSINNLISPIDLLKILSTNGCFTNETKIIFCNNTSETYEINQLDSRSVTMIDKPINILELIQKLAS